MSRIQHTHCRVAVLAGIAGLLAFTASVGQVSAAEAKWRGVECRLSARPSGARVAYCHRSNTVTVPCMVIRLPGSAVSYARRWAALECPGSYPFGGLILSRDSHR